MTEMARTLLEDIRAILLDCLANPAPAAETVRAPPKTKTTAPAKRQKTKTKTKTRSNRR